MVDPARFIREATENIRSNLHGKGILACSGGQDSSLLAVLCSMADRENILAVFVDTGLLRHRESERVRALFEKYSINYRIVNASERFLNGLKGVTDPEQKRKIVGEIFIRVFEEEAVQFGASTLLQGTIAPDWIESGGSVRDTIKSHHNVGGLPKDMKLKLLEPMRDLYKDEVREISEYLKMPIDLQPFPGPGLAVRIPGEVTREKVDLLQNVTDIVERNVVEEYPDINSRPWQYFAILLPVNTTGVHGDRRSYGRAVAIRMIDTSDAMSGTFSHPDWDFLDRVSTEITNSIPSINRVVYDITNKPPGTIEWE